nr:DUF4915 domain-containing protein [Nocardioides alcanivorans]
MLESGRGRLLAVDPETGETAVVAELPGFTRGLGIHRGFAFVGTSQVRETVTFGGLPIAERGDLECGVWAIELTTGRVAASVTFEDRIQELFEVAVLAGVKHPEVAEWGSDLARTSWTVPRPEEPR